MNQSSENFNKVKRKITFLLQLATFSVFIGRAWQHLVWDAPFRTLLWDENWMKGIVQALLGMSWDDYITSPQVDESIQGIISGFGWFYLLCALMVFVIHRWKKVAGFFMILGSLSLIILAMLYCKEKFFSLGQFFEYSLQFGAPLFLWQLVKTEKITSRFLFFLKLTIAFTFVCHGLYAIGYYPRPGYFTQMTLNILGIEESMAINFLNFAAMMDFVIGVGIFLPFKYSKWIIIYAILWGFLTTMARVVAYVELEYFWDTAKQWVHESVYRIPHFLIPLALYTLLQGSSETQIVQREKL